METKTASQRSNDPWNNGHTKIPHIQALNLYFASLFSNYDHFNYWRAAKGTTKMLDKWFSCVGITPLISKQPLIVQKKLCCLKKVGRICQNGERMKRNKNGQNKCITRYINQQNGLWTMSNMTKKFHSLQSIAFYELSKVKFIAHRIFHVSKLLLFLSLMFDQKHVFNDDDVDDDDKSSSSFHSHWAIVVRSLVCKEKNRPIIFTVHKIFVYVVSVINKRIGFHDHFSFSRGNSHKPTQKCQPQWKLRLLLVFCSLWIGVRFFFFEINFWLFLHYVSSIVQFNCVEWHSGASD